MKKRVFIGGILALVLLIGFIGGASPQTQNSNSNTNQSITTDTGANQLNAKKTPTCDGLSVTINCEVDGVKYSTYIYHEAVPEKSHTETITTYREELANYCTLCNDGTYSPSCATGRGACSHHGGVAQWNAPRYRNVPEYTTRNVVDTPAQESYYEKVVSN